MKPYYYCEGSIRGRCSHKHRTYSGATKCLKDDQDGCEMQGGYSDREIYSSDSNQVTIEELYEQE